MILTNNEEMASEDDSGSDILEEIELTTNKRKQGDDNKPTKKLKLDLKPNKNELYKQPTADELNQLKETENLFNSNIFRLQIDELLNEINSKPKHLNQYESWYKSFEKCINEIDEFGEIQLDEYKKYKGKKLTKLQKYLNYSVDKLDNSLFSNRLTNTFVKLIKPSNLFQFGKYSTVSQRSYNVCVTMPKSSFYVKDYLNNIYFTKKYFYLTYLMHALNKLEIIKSVTIDYHLNNKFQPKLILIPNYSDKVQIHLYVVPEQGTFKTSRFTPDKNNVKINVFGCDVSEFVEIGTVLYNSALLYDLTLENNSKFVDDSLSDLKNVQDGIKLLIVWLMQRNLNCGYFAFNNDLLLHVITYLVSKRKINKHMSSYQVVRIFWSFLSSLNDKVLSVCEDLKPSDAVLFQEHFNFSLLDRSGCYNVAAFLNADVLSKVKQEADIALKSLDNNTFNSFAALFTTKIPYGIQYDSILKICGDESTKSSLYEKSLQSDKFKFLGFNDILIVDLLTKYLKKGLTQRVSQLVPIACDDKIIFGINLNLEHCSSVVEKGPKQFDIGADDFKQFWAPLSELRRFKDSSIYEAVYFEDANTIQDKRLIFKQIIKFVLKEKLKLNFKLNGDEMENLLKMNNCVTPFPTGSNEEATLKIKSAYYDLSRLLRELKLPLPITAVQGISDTLSYTDIFPEFARNHICPKSLIQSADYITFKSELRKVPLLVSPIECVIQLALHSKWPRELVALRAMKQMFNFEMSKLLKSEHNIKSIVTESHTDIYYNGFIFRMRLYQPKEISYIKQGVKSDGVVYYKDTEESLEMERTLEVLPKISGALNGIHQECPSFGPSTCLIKRWLRSQMLNAHHISDVVINLLNAALYIDAKPFDKAVLPQVAFLRFLRFMAETDFNNQPIIVNFNNELQNDELNEFETKFLQNRQAYSALYIVTPYDNGKSVFTKTDPTQETLRRISFLAGQTYKHLLASIEGDGLLKYKPFFVPNMDGYDLIIHLKPDMVPKQSFQGVIIDEFNPEKNSKLPIVGFNPVEFYLKELQKNYGEYALFFNDTYSYENIGVLWKEKALEKVDFKVSTVNARRCINDEKLVLNTDALIEDFFILGSDLVEKIVQSKE